MALTPHPEDSAAAPDAGSSPQDIDAEVEAWATRERERRQQWLRGPTLEQAAVAMLRERERRELEGGRANDTRHSDFDAARLIQRLVRTTQLAAEGAVSLLLHVSVRDVRDRLVDAGLEWEEGLFTEEVEGKTDTP